MNVVEFNNVSKRFGAVEAVSSFSLKIPQNIIFGIVGPNGAGKTTLFSLLCGFIRPTSGSVNVFSQSLPAEPNRLTILPQDAQFQSNIPIIEQLTFFLRLAGISGRKLAQDLNRALEIVNLQPYLNRDAATLSHGMHKRLALAQAFLGDPELVILDEPTAGLDVGSREGIHGYIRKLKENKTVIISSHDMDEMEQLCDHVALIEQGRLVRSAPTRHISEHSRSSVYRFNRLLPEQLTAQIAALEHVEKFEQTIESDYRLTYVKPIDDRQLHMVNNKVLQLALAHADQVILLAFREDNPLHKLF